MVSRCSVPHIAQSAAEGPLSWCHCAVCHTLPKVQQKDPCHSVTVQCATHCPKCSRRTPVRVSLCSVPHIAQSAAEGPLSWCQGAVCHTLPKVQQKDPCHGATVQCATNCPKCNRRTPVTVSRCSVPHITKPLIIFSLKRSVASREERSTLTTASF